jgi:hypothetical protein
MTMTVRKALARKRVATLFEACVDQAIVELRRETRLGGAPEKKLLHALESALLTYRREVER